MHRETRVANYLLAALTAISLILLSLPLSGPVRSFKACAVYLLNPIAYEGAKGVERLAGIPPGVGRLLSVDMENQRMLAEMRQASLMKVELEALRHENQRLTQALGLRAQGHGWTPLWARVMERDPLHWYASVMVNAGSEQGVTANVPVLALAEGGRLAAVGRITEVRANSSVVLLLTDELSSAAAYLSSSTLEGLVQGQGGPYLRMNYLNSEAALDTGDHVLTSPTSATFPPDVVIGQVSKVNPRDPFLTFQSVEIKPAVDASTLKELMILLPKGAAGS